MHHNNPQLRPDLAPLVDSVSNLRPLLVVQVQLLNLLEVLALHKTPLEVLHKLRAEECLVVPIPAKLIKALAVDSGQQRRLRVLDPIPILDLVALPVVLLELRNKSMERRSNSNP